MGKSFGTCHHEINGDGISFTRTDEYTREGGEALSYGTYCSNCTLEIYDSGAMEEGALKDLISELYKKQCKFYNRIDK